MRKPDLAIAVGSLLIDAPLAATAVDQTAKWYEQSMRRIVYNKPSAAADMPPLYTLPPRVAARRYSECLSWCVVGVRRKAS